ncbi:MAG: VOC family protein [Deltaproteobacteria bacterium]|nr:VOC family protein [Deltaproteobacteria bacterium]
MKNKKNAINWFEIPVKNFDRGKKFYSSILDAEINEMPHPQLTQLKFGILPFDMNMENCGVGGAIVQGEGYEPSDKGSLIYLNGGDDLSIVLSKVEKAGGKILLPKTSIGQNGFMAHFLDTEGNKVALHSMK